MDKDAKPWDGDDALHDALEKAGWRYATLIGIVDPDDTYLTPEMRARDREAFGHMVKTHEGSPVWDENEAVDFVVSRTNAPADVCAAWLEHDWP